MKSRSFMPFFLALLGTVGLGSSAVYLSNRTVTEAINVSEVSETTETVPSTTTCPEAETSCAEDKAKFCSGPLTKLELVACLQASDISALCRESLECRHNLNQDVLAACINDKAKFCAGVEPSPGSEVLFACLKSHLGELETACSQALVVQETAKPQ